MAWEDHVQRIWPDMPRLCVYFLLGGLAFNDPPANHAASGEISLLLFDFDLALVLPDDFLGPPTSMMPPGPIPMPAKGSPKWPGGDMP